MESPAGWPESSQQSQTAASDNASPCEPAGAASFAWLARVGVISVRAVPAIHGRTDPEEPPLLPETTETQTRRALLTCWEGSMDVQERVDGDGQDRGAAHRRSQCCLCPSGPSPALPEGTGNRRLIQFCHSVGKAANSVDAGRGWGRCLCSDPTGEFLGDHRRGGRPDQGQPGVGAWCRLHRTLGLSCSAPQ